MKTPFWNCRESRRKSRKIRVHSFVNKKNDGAQGRLNLQTNLRGLLRRAVLPNIGKSCLAKRWQDLYGAVSNLSSVPAGLQRTLSSAHSAAAGLHKKAAHLLHDPQRSLSANQQRLDARLQLRLHLSAGDVSEEVQRF